MNEKLITGQGNYGSLDGKPAAAMRYTEAKLSPIGELMLQDINKNTVPFVPNYDNTEEEPVVLPTQFANLLINGSNGIAVGMATSIPPHNPHAVYKALGTFIDSELKGDDPDEDKLIDIIKAPDFPTGANLLHDEKIKDIYKTGHGKVMLQSKYHVEDENTVVITEIPYKINKPAAIEKVDELSREIKNKSTGAVIKPAFPEVKEIRDESTKDIRIVIELKKGANPHKVIQKIFKKTDFETSFSANMLALITDENGGKKPKVFTLVEYLSHFIIHNMSIVKNRTEFDLNKAEDRKEVVEGIIKCLEDIDEVIKTIKLSKTQKEVISNLIEKHELSERQANSIAEMKLRSISQASKDEYDDELEKLNVRIDYYNSILESPITLLKQVKKEFLEIKKRFPKERKTTIITDKYQGQDLTDSDFMDHEDVVITLTNNGQIKSVLTKDFNATNRGTKGVKNGSVKENDFVKFIETVNTKDKLLFFTNKGECHFLPAYEIPITNKNQAAKYIYQYIDLAEGEEIIRMSYLLNKENNSSAPFIMFVTKNGLVKKLDLEQIKTKYKKIRVMNFEEEDELAAVEFVKENEDIMIFTRQGQGLRFNSDLIRPTGRNSKGVKGIKLKKENDAVVSMSVVKNNEILLITEQGFGKRIKTEDILTKNRGGQGIRIFGIKDKTGCLANTISLSEEDQEVIIATKKGIIQRQKIEKISITGNSGIGCKIVNLNKEDLLVSAAAV